MKGGQMATPSDGEPCCQEATSVCSYILRAETGSLRTHLPGDEKLSHDRLPGRRAGGTSAQPAILSCSRRVPRHSAKTQMSCSGPPGRPCECMQDPQGATVHLLPAAIMKIGVIKTTFCHYNKQSQTHTGLQSSAKKTGQKHHRLK